MLRIGYGLALDFWSTNKPMPQLLDEYFELLELAAGLGFDSVWAGENRPSQPQPGHVPSPFIVLASLAGRTELTIGTGVTLVPIWNPLRLAYDSAMLDQITGGRFILGVGLGHPATMRRYGIDPDTAAVRMDETLAALRRLWSGGESFHGSQIHIDGGVNPGPWCPGGPPIWVGGSVQRSVRRAAVYGDAWYGSTPQSLSLITRQADAYRRALAEGGRDPSQARVAINRTTFLAPTDAQAVEEGAAFVGSVIDFYKNLGLIEYPPTVDKAGPVQSDIVFVGSPESCVAALRRYVAAGVNYFNFRVSMGNMPAELVRRTVTLLGERVIPILQD